METRWRDEAAELLDAARALGPAVESLRHRFDNERQLPPELVDAIGDANLYSMWLPRALSGPELPPLSFLEVIEELSRQDGSVGWCTVIPAGYGRLAGAMPLDAASEIFGSGRAALVGTLNPAGKAVPVPGGYRVTGRWSYGSFIAHSQWVLGNCVVQHDGPQEFRLCIVPCGDVEVFDNWHVGGLRGTGSNDYQIDDRFVPAERAIRLDGFSPPPTQPGPLYAVPMLTAFVAGIATVTLGIARAAIDALIEIAAAKTPAGAQSVLREKPPAQIDLARAEALLRSGRALLIDEVGAGWDDVLAGRPMTLRRRALVRLAGCHAAQCAIQATDLMYALGGGTSLFEGNRLERCFRDVHAAVQHFALAPLSNLEPVGRVLHGLDPGQARF